MKAMRIQRLLAASAATLVLSTMIAPALLPAQGRRGSGNGAGAGSPGGTARPDPTHGGPTRTSGTIAGRVTAKGANGETIKAPNVLVQLWNVDGGTAAARDAACTAWLADKNAWTQAREELDYPSGMDLSGSPVGANVSIMRSLLALRRDTTRTDADGNFTFNKVAFGAYTVDAEAIANDKFVQWTSDVAVIPVMPAKVTLDASAVRENQFCTVSADTSNADRIFEVKELDAPLTYRDGTRRPPIPSLTFGSMVVISFIVDETGLPDLGSVKATPPNTSVSQAEARKYVNEIQYNPPTVHGRPVKAKVEVVIKRIM